MPETRKRSSKRDHFPRRNRRRSLSGQEFGDSLVARHVAFAPENAPIDRQRRQTERASMVGERIEKGVGGRIVALRRIAKDARDG